MMNIFFQWTLLKIVDYFQILWNSANVGKNNAILRFNCGDQEEWGGWIHFPTYQRGEI